jgi:hypothetical protein
METLFTVLRIFCVTATLLGMAATARAPRDRAPSVPAHASTEGATPVEAADLTWRGLTVMGLDPFRITRKAPAHRYERLDASAAPSTRALPPPTQMPPPEWRLTGIVWGSAPVAVFEGVEGIEGSALLGEGDSVGAIRVDRLTPDTVILSGQTGSWSFTIQAPWKKGGGS